MSMCPHTSLNVFDLALERCVLCLYKARLFPRLVLCRTAKHGSTSWANNFVKMYLRDRRTVKTQVYLRRLEGNAYSRESKEAVIRALREKQHNYTSFFVCRNPVEKFLSVYNYLMDARVRPEDYELM